jgi:hypothetical protein
VRVIYRKLSTLSIGGKEHVCSKVVGFTTAVIITSSNEHTIFYAHPCLQKHKRYDWAFVHFKEEDGLGGSVENYNACKLLGLISTDGNSCEAVIQCSVQRTSNVLMDRLLSPIYHGCLHAQGFQSVF